MDSSSPESPNSPQPQPEQESAPASPQVQQDLEQDVDVEALFAPDLPEEKESPRREQKPDVGGRDDAFREAVAVMMRGGPNAARSARNVLREVGFSEVEADRFVQAAGYDAARPQEPAPPDPKLVEELKEAKTRAEQAEQRAQMVRAKQLEQEMDYRLYEALSSSELEKFVSRLDEINGEEDDKSRSDRRQVFTQEIRRTALENLGNRTRRAGRFEESWIADEVKRASGQVMGRYRAAIGNVDRIGRISTATGPEEELRQRKPVAPPAWKPGKQASDMDSEIRDWTVDVLSRAAMEGGSGETRL